MLKYAYELGAAAAIEDFTKEAWFRALFSKLTNPESVNRRDFLRHAVAKTVGPALAQLPEAVENATAVGVGLTAAQRAAKAAVKASPEVSRRDTLKAFGAAGVAGIGATTNHIVDKAMPTGTVINGVLDATNTATGRVVGSSRLGRRLELLLKAKDLANTPVSQKTLLDASTLVRDGTLDMGLSKTLGLLGGPEHLGLNMPNFLPGV